MIYLDNAATTKIDPRVVDAMMPCLTDEFGNPGTTYELGRNAKKAIERARMQVAKLINAEPEQIVFTSGGTEANNMVFIALKHYLEKTGRKQIIISAVEHDSVRKSAENMCIKHGFDVVRHRVTDGGKITPTLLRNSLTSSTGLVSVMYMNNEIGSMNAADLLSKVCHANGTLFHTDCVQAAACRPINVKKIDCDFASFSSHKIHGPKGVGALYIKDRSMLDPMIFGGSGQEFGLRGGTENVAGIVGFGAACDILSKTDWIRSAGHIEELKKNFNNALYETLEQNGLADGLTLNGNSSAFGSKIMNYRINGVNAESLVLLVDAAGVCISAGSACNSHESIPSQVLTAIGLTDEEASNSFRVSFDQSNTIEEALTAGEVIGRCIHILYTEGLHESNWMDELG